jgi:AraC family transcriptional regulator
VRSEKLRVPACAHEGTYSGLGDAWSRFMGGWLPSSGRRIGDGPMFEVYRNDPTNAKPEELLTDLHLPIGEPVSDVVHSRLARVARTFA